MQTVGKPHTQHMETKSTHDHTENWKTPSSKSNNNDGINLNENTTPLYIHTVYTANSPTENPKIPIPIPFSLNNQPYSPYTHIYPPTHCIPSHHIHP